MSALADRVSRVDLLSLHDGTAVSLDAATAARNDRAITLSIAADSVQDLGAQLCLITAVLVATRVFGKVKVVLPRDVGLERGPFRGASLSAVARTEGAIIVTEFDASERGPLVMIGATENLDPAIAIAFDAVVYAGATAWTSTVGPIAPPKTSGNVLSCIGAGALAVAESFAFTRDLPGSDAGLREVEIDFWRTSKAAPPLDHAPSDWRIIGLGHLGQALAWVIGNLPYAEQAHATIQDTDFAVPANHSTGVFTPRQPSGQQKTRLVAAALERAGLATAILERSYRAGDRRDDEAHVVALLGVDNLTTRRQISDDNWSLAIDIGLGATGSDFSAISLHRFPNSYSSSRTLSSWQDAPNASQPHPLGQLQDRLGQCGAIELAGTAVGVPFVGVIAAVLAVSEAIKAAVFGEAAEVIDLDLLTLHVRAVDGPAAGRIAAIGLG